MSFVWSKVMERERLIRLIQLIRPQVGEVERDHKKNHGRVLAEVCARHSSVELDAPLYYSG